MVAGLKGVGRRIYCHVSINIAVESLLMVKLDYVSCGRCKRLSFNSFKYRNL